jgi:hypothetical protein
MKQLLGVSGFAAKGNSWIPATNNASDLQAFRPPELLLAYMFQHLLAACQLLLLLLQLHLPCSQLRCSSCSCSWAAEAAGPCGALLQLKLLLESR